MPDTTHQDTSKRPSTLSSIIQTAAVQLDGIGLTDRLISEATVELERDIERCAAAALLRVLTKHIAHLAPAKKSRKSSKSSQTKSEDES